MQLIDDQMKEIVFVKDNFVNSINYLCGLVEDGYKYTSDTNFFLDFHSNLNLAANMCNIYSKQLDSILDETQTMLDTDLKEDESYEQKREEIEGIEQNYRAIRTGIDNALKSLQYIAETESH
jgi:hypothetical protein